MKRALFIYNSGSGDQSIVQKLDMIIHRFQQGGIMVQPYKMIQFSKSRLLSAIKSAPYDFVIISGGDGTLNFVINVLMKNGFQLPIGIMPSGTCNDYAGNLNIPYNIEEAIDIMIAGHTIDTDVGLINDSQYFLSTCAGGVFVGVSFNTHSELKKNFGPLAYYLKGMSEMRNIRSTTLTLTLDDGSVVKEDAYLFLILNGEHGAGFSNLMKEADITDGLMDIMLIRNCNHLEIASIFFKVLTSNNMNDKNITKIQTREVLIEGDRDVDVSVDGEKGPGLPLRIRFLHKAVRVFVKKI